LFFFVDSSRETEVKNKNKKGKKGFLRERKNKKER